MAGTNPPVVLLPTAATINVQSALKTWLNTCTEIPVSAGTISFENLLDNESGMCFATVQAPAYVRCYIMGGYKAQYKFRIIYRVLPTDDSDMLTAVETLAKIGAWCETAAPPDLSGAVNELVTRTSDVAILAAYEDGSSDYSIELTITWEVF